MDILTNLQKNVCFINAFWATAEKELFRQNKNTLKIDAANLLSLIGVLSRSFILEFTIAFLKTFLNSQYSNTQIEKNISKLVREPYLTAIEQFRIASELKYSTSNEEKYREARFRDSLISFDRALSVAGE